MAGESGSRKVVLVGVLKDTRDLSILRKESWYRIPVVDAPKRRFEFIAFYQPTVFGRFGKCIRYYARVLGRRTYTRRELLPKESNHPRANDLYHKIRVGKLRELPHPIINKRFPARRVSFGFTTLHSLRTARNILELYAVNQTEEIVAHALRRAKIPAIAQQYVRGDLGTKRARYFLDFAIPCARGRIAIECDNNKAHRSVTQRMKDVAKDRFLKENGWVVIRLTEEEVLNSLSVCVSRIQRASVRLGGVRAV